MDDGSGTTNGTRFGITEAAHHGDECTTLLGVLQRQRDLVAWKLRDIPDDVLSAVATPTGHGPPRPRAPPHQCGALVAARRLRR